MSEMLDQSKIRIWPLLPTLIMVRRRWSMPCLSKLERSVQTKANRTVLWTPMTSKRTWHHDSFEKYRDSL